MTGDRSGYQKIMWMVLVIPLLVMSFALLMERVEANVPERDPSRAPEPI